MGRYGSGTVFLVVDSKPCRHSFPRNNIPVCCMADTERRYRCRKRVTFNSEYIGNRLSVALRLDPPRKLTTLPRFFGWIWRRGTPEQGRDTKKKEGKRLKGEEREEKGAVPYRNFFFSTFVFACSRPLVTDTTAYVCVCVCVCVCEQLAHSRTRDLSVANPTHYTTDCRVRIHSGCQPNAHPADVTAIDVDGRRSF